MERIPKSAQKVDPDETRTRDLSITVRRYATELPPLPVLWLYDLIHGVSGSPSVRKMLTAYFLCSGVGSIQLKTAVSRDSTKAIMGSTPSGSEVSQSGYNTGVSDDLSVRDSP